MKSTIEQKIEQSYQQEIDLAPLLDVVFILLIFFIVTTVFVRETGVEVDKPTAVSSETMQRTIILLAITSAGEVVYDGTNIGVEAVRGTVAQLLLTGEKPLVVQADKSVPTDLLVRVIDQAKLGGVESVSIATANE